MNSICVFCGSSTGFGEKYKEGAVSLGIEIARRGLHLVYGGGNVGLMGLLAQTVLEGGGRVTGIIPEAIHKKVKLLQGGRTIVVADMHSRKMKMHEESDGFIALPGGIGTFEEILEAFTWSQLGFHKKPVALLNTEGYYQSLLDQFVHSVQEGFFKESHNRTLLIHEDSSTLLDAMDLYKPLIEDKWINP
ncbi:TIGR00730 family Rossman fold protein [Oceanispirochaeta sp.]|uniref:LOG family protein n=1 Tax=Oceanispirochaeta sp. TaxID=2035350 RepID=UPI0026212209|nr:TIGR00730 family Rossman fold protein [Oceanispirochaeta sp.]MDA3956008.1 TIGR00730 family Rossman fold protein [Oceanispirochaeta sp.]